MDALWITERLIPPESFAQQKGRRRGVTALSYCRRSGARLSCATIESASGNCPSDACTTNNAKQQHGRRGNLGCLLQERIPSAESIGGSVCKTVRSFKSKMPGQIRDSSDDGLGPDASHRILARRRGSAGGRQWKAGETARR